MRPLTPLFICLYLRVRLAVDAILGSSESALIFVKSNQTKQISENSCSTLTKQTSFI